MYKTAINGPRYHLYAAVQHVQEPLGHGRLILFRVVGGLRGKLAEKSANDLLQIRKEGRVRNVCDLTARSLAAALAKRKDDNHDPSVRLNTKGTRDSPTAHSPKRQHLLEQPVERCRRHAHPLAEVCTRPCAET